MTLALRCAVVLAASAILAGGAATAAPRALAPPRTGVRALDTGVVEPVDFAGAKAASAFARTRSAGATIVRLSLDWRNVAPPSPPRGFDPRDPEDPAYRWGPFDAELENAVLHDLDPLVTLTNAPAWGRRPDGLADPLDFARFVRAAATRYSGKDGRPLVRRWQVWNEPNHPGRPALKTKVAAWYRDLVNRAAAVLHDVDRRNDVVAGGCSPFTTTTAVGPLHFMRQLFEKPVTFDVWSHHPYTSGGPTHHANGNDDVSLGDLPEMGSLLRGAVRAHTVRSSRSVRFWVTEFAWDTSPPDPQAVPLTLQARWTAEALYRMWAAGVSTVVWWRLRDEPLRTSFYQSGLYFRDWRPKRTLYAFRFPFVAFAEEGRVLAWGRTPAGRPGTVTVEQSVDGSWRRLGGLRTDRYGIFSQVYATSAEGSLRARLSTGDASLPFSLQVPPDHFYYPFGS